MKTKTLVLIPAYNESAKIRTVIEGAIEHLPVLVVDDASSDDTAAISRQSGASVIRQAQNLGKGAALKAGFQYALEKGFSHVIILDGDGQHDPHEIPIFLTCYEVAGGSLIIGKRDFAQMPFSRRLANSLGRFLINMISRENIPDNQSGYRMLDRKVMELMLDSDEMGFEFEVEMIFTCHSNGFNINWVPIRTIYADETSHISSLKHISNYLRILIKMLKSYKSK